MSDRVYRAVNLVGRGLMRALDLTVRRSGVEHLPSVGPVILAATHVAYPDFIFIEQAAVERARFVRFMCRHDVWRNRPVSWAMDRMQHIPVDRAAPAAAYLRARRLLGEGQAVGVFPEAGISYSYAVRPLMRGVAALARETGAPVIPVAVWGSQRVWSVGDPEPRPSFRRGRIVDVTFAPALRVSADDDLTEWTVMLGGRLTEMLEELQRLPEHRPQPGERAVWYPAHLGGHAPTRAQALALDEVPRSAIMPAWGPPLYG